jgi:hypothetical protein
VKAAMKEAKDVLATPKMLSSELRMRQIQDLNYQNSSEADE